MNTLSTVTAFTDENIALLNDVVVVFVVALTLGIKNKMKVKVSKKADGN